MRAVVVGSLNMDLILRVPEFASRGQTVLSRALDRSPGGKGANQAVALSRLGAEVEMVGAVGRDGDGAAQHVPTWRRRCSPTPRPAGGCGSW